MLSALALMLRSKSPFLALFACWLWAEAASAQGGPPMSARGAGAGTAGDRGEETVEEGEAEEEPKMVPWRGTALKWSQSVTTTALGIGGDYQSDSNEVYSHGFWALLNYFVADEELWSWRVATSPGFDVELTDSNTTTTQHEPLFRDLNLTSVITWNAWENERRDVFFTVLPNATVFFPTSKISQNTGTHFVTSPRLTLALTTPFIKGTDFFNAVSFLASGRWDHQFTDATVPTNESVAVAARTRTNLTYSQYFADQLSGVAYAHDSVTAGGAVWFQGAQVANRPLDLSISAQWSKDYLYGFSDAQLSEAGGGSQIDVGGLENPATTRTRTNFSVTLSYYPMPEWGLSLGYTNSSSDLAPDGQRRSIFYSPNAAFTTLFILSIDALYEMMTGPRRPANFTLPG